MLWLKILQATTYLRGGAFDGNIRFRNTALICTNVLLASEVFSGINPILLPFLQTEIFEFEARVKN
jgi:hypothetical protein